MSTIRAHPDKFSGRTVLLVAGTSGIGKGVASALVSRGTKVILTSTTQSKLDDTISQLHKLYPNQPKPTGYILGLKGEGVEDNIKQLVSSLQKDSITKIHHLVYIAGDSLAMQPIDQVTQESWFAASQVRIISAVLVVKHILPFLKAAGPADATCSPSITLTSGSIGDKPIPGGWTLIAPVGAGVQALARQLGADLAPLRVNSVTPDLVDTDLWKEMDEETKQGFFKEHCAKAPTGRVGDVLDVAEAYLYVMADGNITGESIRTNSGKLLV